MIKCLLYLLMFSAMASVDAGTLNFSGIGGAYSVPVTSLKESKFSSTMRQQYDFSCGSAAVATLLTHQYGYAISEQAVFQAMYATGDKNKIRREGFSLLDMKRFLETQGFTADGFRQSLDTLENAQLPAIALINEKGYHHFVVIKGMRDGRILLGDPSSGTRTISRTSFEAVWVNQLLFVIHNRQELARFNVATDWNAAPTAPIANGIRRDGLESVTIPKLGVSDF